MSLRRAETKHGSPASEQSCPGIANSTEPLAAASGAATSPELSRNVPVQYKVACTITEPVGTTIAALDELK